MTTTWHYILPPPEESSTNIPEQHLFLKYFVTFYCTVKGCLEQILFCPFPIAVNGLSSLPNHPEFLPLAFSHFKSIPTHPCFADPGSWSPPGFPLAPFSLSCPLFALRAWVLLSHTLWLQLHSPVSPLTKRPQDMAIINCVPCLVQGTFLRGQTPYWTQTRQMRTTPPARASALQIKGELLQRGFCVHDLKNENIQEGFTRSAGILNGSNVKMEMQLVFWMGRLSVTVLDWFHVFIHQVMNLSKRGKNVWA